MSGIRLGLIGCGGMATTHARRFEKLGSRVSVVASVDSAQDRARAVAELLPDCRPATAYREILEDVDAVLIALPHHLHHPVALECMAAGKHVMLEKPMAITEQECLDLIGASEKHKRVLMIAYLMRFNPLAIKLKELIDQKAYGDVFQVSIWTEQRTHKPQGDWHNSAATLGGGQLFSHGCHYIDLLLWYLGRPVRGTHVGTNYGTPWMEKEGTSNVSMEFESGALGYHFGTWGAAGTRLAYSFHAHCTEAMIEADITNGQLKVLRNVRGEAYRDDEAEVLLEGERVKSPENEMAHFLGCIETGAVPFTDGPSSLQGLRVIWRLYEAEAENVVADLRGLGLDEYRDRT